MCLCIRSMDRGTWLPFVLWPDESPPKAIKHSFMAANFVDKDLWTSTSSDPFANLRLSVHCSSMFEHCWTQWLVFFGLSSMLSPAILLVLEKLSSAKSLFKHVMLG